MSALIGPQYKDYFMLQVLCASSPLHIITEELHPALLIPAPAGTPTEEPAPGTAPGGAGDGRLQEAQELPTIAEVSEEDDSSFEAMAADWFLSE